MLRRKTRKALSVMLSVCLIAMTCSVLALAADTYTVTFVTDGTCTVNAYSSSDYTTASVTENVTSMTSNSDQQVNFLIVPASGYEVDSVTVTSGTGYKNLKGPADTAVTNMYRVTKITSDLTVTITLKASSGEAVTQYTAAFSTDSHSSVTTFTTSDPSTAVSETNAAAALARDADSGEVTVTGDGQINFEIVVSSGYEVASVTVTPAANYNNLKDVSTDTYTNLYRITKVCGDLTVVITTKEQTDENTVITFSDSGAALTSGSLSGFTITGTNVSFYSAGTYYLTGSCSDGSITVASDAGAVNLVLDGLKLTCTTTSPLDANGPGTTIPTVLTVTLADGTVNTLTDTDRSAAAPKSVLNTPGDLVINGTGALVINSKNKNGIKADGTLLIDGAPTISVTTVGNGISSDGDMTVTGGSITVVSALDGISCTKDINISGGTFNITSGGGRSSSVSNYNGDDSCKGLKAGDSDTSGNSLTITGGTFTISALDDAIHSNGDAAVSAGSFTLASSDDAIHADDTLSLGAQGAADSSLTVTVTNCYEGLEGGCVYIYSGNISVNSSDDGINSASGTTSTAAGNGGFGGGTATAGCDIHIEGGNTFVSTSAGDGVDSNNSIYMDAGTLIVFGCSTDSNRGNNSAIDYETACVVDGGTLLAVGANTGMTQVPTSASTQACLIFTPSSFNTKGTITIKSSTGTVYTYESSVSKTANHVVFSSPELASSGSYTLTAGSVTATTTPGSGMGQGGQTPGGTFPGG